MFYLRKHNNMNDKTQEIMKKREAAEYLRVTPSFLEQQARNGVGPKFYRMGTNNKTIRYMKRDLDAYLMNGVTSDEI